VDKWLGNNDEVHSKQKYSQKKNLNFNNKIRQLSKTMPNVFHSLKEKNDKNKTSKTESHSKEINSNSILTDIETKTSESGDTDSKSIATPETANKASLISSALSARSNISQQTMKSISTAKTTQNISANSNRSSIASKQRTILISTDRKPLKTIKHVDFFAENNTKTYTISESLDASANIRKGKCNKIIVLNSWVFPKISNQ
jgi:hypothetical protein